MLAHGDFCRSWGEWNQTGGRFVRLLSEDQADALQSSAGVTTANPEVLHSATATEVLRGG